MNILATAAESGLENATWGLVWVTGALAAFTAIMAGATFWLAKESKEASLRQIGVQTWLEFEKLFDSRRNRRARKNLAGMMPYEPRRHAEYDEDLLMVFESISIAFNEGYLNEKLADCSFGHYAVGWWDSMEQWIKTERRQNQLGNSLYCEFEKFAGRMRDPKTPVTHLSQFWKEEMELNVD